MLLYSLLFLFAPGALPRISSLNSDRAWPLLAPLACRLKRTHLLSPSPSRYPETAPVISHCASSTNLTPSAGAPDRLRGHRVLHSGVRDQYGHKLIDNGFISRENKKEGNDFRKTFGYKKNNNAPVKYKTENGLDYWKFPDNKKMSPETKQRIKDFDTLKMKDKGIDYGTIVVDDKSSGIKEEYSIIDEDEIKKQRKNLEEDDDNLETIGVKDILENNLQDELSDNLEVGSIVKLRQRGKLFSKDNFTIMGFNKRDNEYLIRNPKTGEVLMKEKDDILTGISSLDDPRNLKIGDKAELKLDTIYEDGDESSIIISPDYGPPLYDEPVEELIVEDYDEDNTAEMMEGMIDDFEPTMDDDKEEKTRKVISKDKTNEELNFLSIPDESKEEYTDEQNKNLSEQKLMYKKI